MKKEKSNFLNNNISLIIAIALLLIGISIVAYPSISNYIAEKNQTEVVESYIQKVYEVKDLSGEYEKAQIYNENLAGDPLHDPFVIGSGYALPNNYKEVLNITNDGVMGYIEIPKISVYLPIYHGTSEEVLELGVGHIENSSLPIGGISTHSVLTGHTGLPKAELFTKLVDLKIGDIFYIHVLDKLLTYKVYETKVILPEKIDELQIVNGKDYVTLVTCTPYGINTHRLLVKAERTEYEEYIASKESNKNIYEEEVKSKNYYLIGVQIGSVVVLAIIFIIFIWNLYRKSKEKNKKNEKQEKKEIEKQKKKENERQEKKEIEKQEKKENEKKKKKKDQK